MNAGLPAGLDAVSSSSERATQRDQGATGRARPGRRGWALFAAGGILVGMASARGQTTHRVELAGIDFTPADIAIRLCDTVHWVWVQGFHNVESGIVVNRDGVHDGNFRSGDPTLVAGTTFDLTFDEALLTAAPMPGNVYPYFCIVHAGLNMIGSVTVLADGDVDGDTDIDLLDHRAQVDCASGPDSALTVGDCSDVGFDRSDIDRDGDVDLRDVAAIQLAFTG